ncbi:hypothetical protein BDR03DRAFT_965034 [Suillus americanus]|nr:hypothetical protein BDR03DRAFT_965034 [Suillus americanus]
MLPVFSLLIKCIMPGVLTALMASITSPCEAQCTYKTTTSPHCTSAVPQQFTVFILLIRLLMMFPFHDNRLKHCMPVGSKFAFLPVRLAPCGR